MALLKAVVENELKGIVGKKLDSPYRAGRWYDWIKVRASTSRPQERH